MFFSNKIISRQKSWGDLVQPQITEYYIVIPAKQLIQFLQIILRETPEKDYWSQLLQLKKLKGETNFQTKF